jgi:AraC family transcriptional regulator
MNHAVVGAPLSFRHHQSFGDCKLQLSLAGMVIRDTRLLASCTLPRHEHAAAYICIVLEGGYTERAQDEIVCDPGSVVAHPRGHVHANSTGPAGARCVNVELDEALLVDSPLALLARSEGHRRLPPIHPALASLSSALAQADSTAALATYAATLDVLCAAIRAPRPTGGGRWLQRVVDFLESDLAHTPTLDQLAGLAGVHANHLIRIFKQQQGETVGSYLRRRRLELADTRLRLGESALGRIAAEAGFYDQAHFTRVYRRHFGITPGQRRKEYRRVQ